ncbi:DEAD/DEAH box helicase [Thiorhodovibrio frisius]|uniref:DNA/RNA helicase, superfamily II n=1 Tax=Thiorhodovibrio frisius TaxID=631362 RepID=H8YYZ6_9GAMM|nr:DEAD/DEAH box helicase [Thiorhodovibrio frisius]EIC21923.1 DNA/RNA helicase, superfamily II [Thiorhodovibrio frisius]WPL24212.1 ATP-dependent RNA helicase SrmB [Thiorhodovibrio frisius]
MKASGMIPEQNSVQNPPRADSEASLPISPLAESQTGSQVGSQTGSQTGFAVFPLAEPLQRGLVKAGFSEPTPVQQAVIPAALAGADLLVAAATGSGKTAAFLLPVMQRLLERPAPRAATRVLILVPTRELATQIETHFFALGSYSRLGIGVIIGGASRARQISILRKNPELIVATPGRLLDQLRAGEVDLGDLECLVLDEADRMLDLGFAEDVLAILECCNPARQSLLFSATLHHRHLQGLIGPALREPQVLRIDSPRAPSALIRHQLIRSNDLVQKQAQLLGLLGTEPVRLALVFVNQRERTLELTGQLRAAGHRAAALHGELDQRERERVLGLFRAGQLRMLVATEVAARGLDIPDVDLVVHYDPPPRGDDYLHRSGRTGRAGAVGLAVTLVTAADWHRMDNIRRYLGLELEERVLPGLKASFRIPPKRGKAKGSRSGKPKGAGAQAATAVKPKGRWRDRKQLGRPRGPRSPS